MPERSASARLTPVRLVGLIATAFVVVAAVGGYVVQWQHRSITYIVHVHTSDAAGHSIPPTVQIPHQELTSSATTTALPDGTLQVSITTHVQPSLAISSSGFETVRIALQPADHDLAVTLRPLSKAP